MRELSISRLALKRLQRFPEAQKIIHIREMTVDNLETFKTAGLPKAMRMTTKATTFAKILCFLRAAFRRGDKRGARRQGHDSEGCVRPEGTVHR